MCLCELLRVFELVDSSHCVCIAFEDCVLVMIIELVVSHMTVHRLW